MEVTVEKVSNLKRKMTVIVPADEVDKKANLKLEELAGKVKLAGFRPGKVPFKVVKERYGQSARDDVVNNLLSATYFQALEQEKLNPAGQPVIEPSDSEFGKPFKYVASFEVYPEIKLTELADVKLEKLLAEVTEQDIDAAVQKMCKQHVTWEDVERSAQDGDQLVIDFTGTIKGEEFEGGSAKEFKLELGAGKMLPDFEKGLQKVKAGDDTKFKVKFPKDYSDGGVAGKKAEFVIKVHKVQEGKLPEMDQEFFEKIGIREGGEAKLREKIKEHMDRELEEMLRSKYKKQVLDKLLELNPLELPGVLVESEIASLQNQMKQQYAQMTNKKPEEIPDSPRDYFVKDAERRVHLGLVLSEMVKVHKIKVEEAELKTKIREMAAGYDKPDEFVEWYCSDKRRLGAVESVVLEEKMIADLQNQVVVTEKKVSYDEAVKQDIEDKE